MLKFWKDFPEELKNEARDLVEESEFLLIFQSDDNGLKGYCVAPSVDLCFWLGQWPTVEEARRAVEPLKKEIQVAKNVFQ